MKVFVFSRRDLGLEAVQVRFANDTAMDPYPYGFNREYMEDLQVEYSASKPKDWLAERLHGFLHFDICHAVDNLSALRRADVIWTVIEWEWLSASLLQKLGLLQLKPIVSNSVFLAYEFRRLGRRVRLLWPLLMTRWTFLTLHSKAAATILAVLFPRRSFTFLPFGISTSAFPPRPPRQRVGGEAIRVYSIGYDGTRDWETLLEAVGDSAEFDLTVACGRVGEALKARYPRVIFVFDPSVSQQRELYEAADVVAVVMKTNNYSGITVACEAASMGVPIVSTRTGGIPSYFDEDEIEFVEPNDVPAVREAIRQASRIYGYDKSVRAYARFESSDYSSKGMVRRYVEVSRMLLFSKMGPQ